MKFKTLILGALAATAMVSCTDSKNEYHQASFYPLRQYIPTYADQTLDSTRVVSTDTWTFDEDCSWLTVTSNGESTPLTFTVPEGYISSSRLDLHLAPNTTGKVRKYSLMANVQYHKIGVITQQLVQYPYHHITFPDVRLTGEGEDQKYSFSMLVTTDGKLIGMGKTPYITFVPYGGDATLTSSESWVRPKQQLGFEKDKSNQIELEVDANNTDQKRTATLTLTSNGVSTPITIEQEKKD